MTGKYDFHIRRVMIVVYLAWRTEGISVMGCGRYPLPDVIPHLPSVKLRVSNGELLLRCGIMLLVNRGDGNTLIRNCFSDTDTLTYEVFALID